MNDLNLIFVISPQLCGKHYAVPEKLGLESEKVFESETYVLLKIGTPQ